MCSPQLTCVPLQHALHLLPSDYNAFVIKIHEHTPHHIPQFNTWTTFIDRSINELVSELKERETHTHTDGHTDTRCQNSYTAAGAGCNEVVS